MAARAFGILAAAAFGVLLLHGVLARAPSTKIDDALAGNRAVTAPGFELSVLSGGRPAPLRSVWERAARNGRVNLDELGGTPVVVNFWASWCPPCRDEAPVLERGWRRAQQRGVLFIGLDMQDVREDAHRFLREFKLDFPNVRDPTKDTARQWETTGIPETFFITRQGRIVGHVIGAVSTRQLDDGVDAALAGRSRAAAQGGARQSSR